MTKLSNQAEEYKQVRSPRNMPNAPDTSIRAMRMAAGMTQAALANILNVSKRTIENWEGDKRHIQPYVFRLVEYFLIHEGFLSHDWNTTAQSLPNQAALRQGKASGEGGTP